MSSVVMGSAITIPKMPNNEPQMESDNSIMAELSPMTCPMILGVRMVSWIICTTANTMSTPSMMSQKLCPVSAAFTTARRMAGMKPMSCR